MGQGRELGAGSILKWAGGALLLGGWVSQSFLADKWGTRADFINEAIFEAAALHTTNLLYEDSSVLRIEEQHGIDVAGKIRDECYVHTVEFVRTDGS
ncbi:MAG TPA: hypothetical protein VGV15_02425 [Terriglobales bacterium]|nr:hypothetical protein [Terriglobales bacterium]